MRLFKKAIVGIILAHAAVIVFGVTPARAADSDVEMVNMNADPSEFVQIQDDVITDSNGDAQSSDVVEFDVGNNAFATYDLDGEYSSFTFTITCSQQSDDNAEMYVGFFADEELVYDIKEFTNQSTSVTNTINLAGVGKLSIKTAKTKGEFCSLYFVNSAFSKADVTSPFTTRVSLCDLKISDSHSTEMSNKLFVDASGDIHNGKIRLATLEDPYVIFNLHGKYTVLSGRLVSEDNTGRDVSAYTKFYLDDAEVESSRIRKSDDEQDAFSINVSGANTLKIAASNNVDGHEYINVADAILEQHEHTPGEWITEIEPTCTGQGRKIQRCSTCGEVLNTETLPAIGHKPDGEWREQPQNGSSGEGEQVQYCSVCGQVAKTRSSKNDDDLPGDEVTDESVNQQRKNDDVLPSDEVFDESINEQRDDDDNTRIGLLTLVPALLGCIIVVLIKRKRNK